MMDAVNDKYLTITIFAVISFLSCEENSRRADITKCKYKFILLMFFSVCHSCQMDCDLSVEEAQKAIIGKWELVSYGMYKNDMIAGRRDGSYTEYCRDGTQQTFMVGDAPHLPPVWLPSGIRGFFTPPYYYTVDGNYLKVMSVEGGIESCYKYTFQNNKKTLK